MSDSTQTATQPTTEQHTEAQESQEKDDQYYKVPPRVMSAKGKALDLMARGASWFGMSAFKLNKELIMEYAAKSVALHAPGLSDQTPFLARLKCFLDGIDESTVPPLSRMIFTSNFSNFMKNRLSAVEYIIAHPEVTQQQLKPMLFIAGLPRTGTTVLQKVLASDPIARSLLMWETDFGGNSLPPSTSREQTKTDPRIEECRKQMEIASSIFPEYWENIGQSHFMSPDEPDEETLIMQMCAMFALHGIRSSKAYREDLYGDDNEDGTSPYGKKDMYQFLKIYYQIMQSGFAPEHHWILKAPFHCLYLNDLEREIPDMRMVFTHRDPKETVASYCALQEAFIAHLYYDGVWDRREIGKFVLEFLSLFTKRSLVWQKKTDPSKYINIHYLETVKNPIETVKKIYNHFGYGDLRYSIIAAPMNQEAIEAIEKWQKENPQGKHGRKKYSLEQFGLTPEQIEKEFAEYYTFLDELTKGNQKQ